MEERESYIIGKNTMMIEPYFTNLNEHWTLIREVHGTYIVKQSPLKVINESLIVNGAGLEGRTETSKFILDKVRMLPIMLSEYFGIVLMPLSSRRDPDCIWVILSHIERVIDMKQKSQIQFKNGEKITTKFSKCWMQLKIADATRVHFYFFRLHKKDERVNFRFPLLDE